MAVSSPPRGKNDRHRAGGRANVRHRFQLLLLVLGSLALLLAALLAVLTLLHDDMTRNNLMSLALYHAAGGVACLVLRFILHTLPAWTSQRKSPTYQRRREQSLRRQQSERSSERGSVLILVLILLGLLSALVLQVQLHARGQLRAEQESLRARDLQRAATDAARAALHRIADDPDLATDHTNEAWAASEEISTPLGISILTRVRDESRRFDLNNLRVKVQNGQRQPDDVLMDLLTLCGDFTPSLKVAALRDFVDADDLGTRESDFYRRQQPPYAAVNRALYGWGEVMHVEGWGREQFVRRPRTGLPGNFDGDLVDCVTLLPLARERPLPVNVNTATRETLTGVLGFEHDDLVNAILTFRTLKPIRSLEPLSVLVDADYFESVRPYLDVRSRVFRVDAQAFADGRRTHVRALAVRDQQGEISVVQWYL